MFMYQIQAGIKWIEPYQLSWGWGEQYTPCDNHTHTSAGRIQLGVFILVVQKFLSEENKKL